MKSQRRQLSQYGAPLQHMANWLLAATGFVSCALGQELLAAKHDYPGFPPSVQVGVKVCAPLPGARLSFLNLPEIHLLLIFC